MKLQLRFRAMPHPFAGEPAAAHELWGEVRLVYDYDGGEVDLLHHEWDLLKLGEWIPEVGCTAMTASLPEEPREDESLAEALARQSQRACDSFADEAESDAWFERLYAYRRAHSSRFALRGAEIPEVIVGINRGDGEVSRCEGERWSYRFHFETFRRDFIRALLKMRRHPYRGLRTCETGSRLYVRRLVNALASLDRSAAHFRVIPPTP